MNAIKMIGLAAALFCISTVAFGQASAPPAPAQAEDDDTPAQTSGVKKRDACRKEGTDKGLRGPDLVDHVQVCVLEGRLACLKQAITQKIRGKDRATYIGKCMEGSA